jgi:purine-cytosine permease-like protein
MTTKVSNVGSEAATRDDYALRQVPPTWRYPGSSLVLALGGGATAAFFLAFPAQLAASFGVLNVLIGMAYALVLQTALNYVFVRKASCTGLNSDLMSRGLALGFDGSAWTTLVYWATWVIFFAVEGQILAGALAQLLRLPDWSSYLIVGAIFLPLVAYGISFMYRFQKWTLYLYLLGLALLLARVFTMPDLGTSVSNAGELSEGATLGGLGLLGVIAAYNGLIGNVTFGHADVGRLLANDRSLVSGKKTDVFWLSFLPYSFMAYVVFGLLGLLFWTVTEETNPGKYFVELIGVVGFLLIIVTQMRINLINAYSGSLCLANFFSRLKFTPNRSFWAVVMVGVGVALMFGNVLAHVEAILTFEGVLIAAWLGVVFTDMVFVRGVKGYGPKNGQFIEYRRAMLTHWNMVGVLPLVASTILGATLALGGATGVLGGEVLLYVSGFVTFLVAGLLTLLLGLRDRGRSYAVRDLIGWPRDDSVVECPIDNEVVSTADMFPCPFHEKWICATDCMGTRGCGEMCKSHTEEQLLQIPLPPRTERLRSVNDRLSEKSNASEAPQG